MNALFKKLNPAVRKPILILLSGIVWLGTGIMLISMAVSWFKNSANQYAIWFALTGVLAGVIIHRFGFLRIVNKNLDRIRKIEDLYCAFGFMPWKSYIMVASMMTMGIILRDSACPKEYLLIIYMGIGLALALSSTRYFLNIRKC